MSLARIFAMATAVLLAGCGAPGLTGRGVSFADPGGPVSVPRQEWGSSMCSKRGCTGRCGSDSCGSATCGVSISTTGLAPAPKSKVETDK